jgi:endonuclease/exonuclease/phosphatase family metal-dependent hydrolase
MSLTLVSWNLKGSKGVDVRAVVDHLEAMAADVVVLQEVQPGQAHAIARSLGARPGTGASSTGPSARGPRAWR